MKELQKFASILRELDVWAHIVDEGTENEFLCVRDNNNHGISFEWEIWYVDNYYEIHLFANNELMYDQTYLYTPLFVVGQITSDIQKY